MMEDPVARSGATTAVKILCCTCGVPIDPNPSNTCAACLASRTDVTRGISTEATLHQCRGCKRWHKDAGKWIGCELESRELMSLCLSNVSGLKNNSSSSAGGGRLRLVDAGWVWTEPHSMRLKVRLTIQREVQAGTILQQSFVVTFVVRNQQCVECQAEFRQGSWKSLVQVRQRVSHKRTFLYLEQLILKHGAHRGCLSIETFRDGMDFYFPDKGKAARFISFLENVVPVKIKTSKKLIGTDDKSNVSNFKYTNLVEICPLCKDDLLYLPKKLATNLGNISRCVMVKNVSNLIHLVDPLTGQSASLSPEAFWRDPIRPLVTAGRSRLMRYVVLGKEATSVERNVSRRRTSARQRNRVALLTLAREDDLGVTDTQFVQTSHLGYLLKAGDVCVGYDLAEIQFVDEEAEEAREAGKLPDVIVVRKLYGDAAADVGSKKRGRMWQLQRLDVDVAEALKSKTSRKEKDEDDMDEEDFMREVEADKEMRNNMFLYKCQISEKQDEASEMADGNVDEADQDDHDDQAVKLDELLDGLVLKEGFEEVVHESANASCLLEEGERAAKDGIGYTGRDEARMMKPKDSAAPVGDSFGKEFAGKDFKFT